jgi:hypothetical protein
VGIGVVAPGQLLSLQAPSVTTPKTLTLDMLSLSNSYWNADMDGVSSSILWRHATSAAGATMADSGRITVGTETDWTSTAADQDSYMALSTCLNGTVAERLRISSAGVVSAYNNITTTLNTSTFTVNVGYGGNIVFSDTWANVSAAPALVLTNALRQWQFQAPYARDQFEIGSSAGGISPAFAIAPSGVCSYYSRNSDPTSNLDSLVIERVDNAASMTNCRTSILFNQWYYDVATPAVADAAKITVGTEGNWTSTASTQDAYMAFHTALDGTVAEKLRITSDGKVGIGVAAPAFLLQTDVNYSGATDWQVAGAFMNSALATTKSHQIYVGRAVGSTGFVGYYYDSGTPANCYASFGVSSSTPVRVWATGDTVLGTMTFAGKVGFGMTAPGYPLCVAGATPANTYDCTVEMRSTETTGAINTGPALGFSICDGSGNWRTHAAIRGMKENATVGQYGGYLSFLTRANGSTPAEAMRITSDGKVGIGVAAPSQALDLIGSLELEATTSATTGVIYKGADRFIHNFRNMTGGPAGGANTGNNLFFGIGAGNFTMGGTGGVHEGSYNVGIGASSLAINTTGFSNVGIGASSLAGNTTGYYNVACGIAALTTNAGGNYNIAFGPTSLQYNISGEYNIGIGNAALQTNSTGSYNIGIGSRAGAYETGSYKLYIASSDTTTPLIYGDFATGKLTFHTIGASKVNTDGLALTNLYNAADMDGTATSLLFRQYYYDAVTPAAVDAGRITVGTETDWTSTASTQDVYMAFGVSKAGNVEERLRLYSPDAYGMIAKFSSTGSAKPLYIYSDAGGSGIASNLNVGSGCYMYMGPTGTLVYWVPSGTISWQGGSSPYEKMSVDITTGQLRIGQGYTTPATALLIDIAALTGSGTKDSHSIQLTARSYDSGAHNIDWKEYVDATVTSGVSLMTWQSRVDSNDYTTRMSLRDNGYLTVSETEVTTTSGLIVTSPNGTRYRIWVQDGGTLTTTAA